MENLQIDLLIDLDPSASQELKKWKEVVQNYLIYGLNGKGIKVNIPNVILEADNLGNIQHKNFVYLPILTTNLSSVYLERIKLVSNSQILSSSIKIGLLKEEGSLKVFENLFSDLKIWKMFIIDHDNGLEISDVDIWKKENFNFLLFKIVDLCNEIEKELKSVHSENLSKDTKAVYLADTTPDLISIREEIKRELVRKGFLVFSKNTLSGNVKDVEKGIIDLLQKSVLSIHLFGKLYSESKFSEELENKIAAQFYLSRKESKKNSNPFRRIIWFPDNLIVSDEKQLKVLEALQKEKKLYAGADIIKSSVEELKDIILEKLTEKLQKMAGAMIVQKKLLSIKDCLRVE